MARAGEAAVAIDQQRHVVAQRLAHGRHDGLGAAGPFVDVVAALARRPGT
jgi:hypothetical protein